MSKALNQDEIDFLLGGGGPEEDPSLPEALSTHAIQAALDGEERVSRYNFKRPRLFSQEQVRILQYVHESFARDMSVYLSAQLRTMIDIVLAAVDQVLYAEYVMSSQSPSALWVARAKGLNQQLIFEIDPSLCLYTIEKLFGGPGVFMDDNRELTHIEKRIMTKVIHRGFRELEQAWHQAHDLHLEEDAFESNAEFVQILPSMEPAMVATFEVRLHDRSSFINICYPYLLLEKMLGRSGMQQWVSRTTTEVGPTTRQRYEDRIRRTDVEVRAELGRTRLTLADIAQLQPGDVIPLDGRADDPVRVFVDRHEKFSGHPGRSGKRRALRIASVVEPEEPLFVEDPHFVDPAGTLASPPATATPPVHAAAA